MLRFIADNGELSNQETYWRNGIIYKSPTTQSMIKVEYDHNQSTFTVCVQDRQKQALDMQNIVEQFVKLENSDDNIKISNDGKIYLELRTIRKLQHGNSRGTIYENGELIPLSKFDWLTQKIETEAPMEFEQMKNRIERLISQGRLLEALNVLSGHAVSTNNDQLRQGIVLLKAGFTRITNEKTVGLISYTDAGVQMTQLGNNILTMLNSLNHSEPNSYVEPTNTPSNDLGKTAAQPNTPKHPLSIFISYSKRDNELREELDTHLAGLRRRKIVTHWDDRHIIGGELWDDTIKTKLKEADIILFLVSANFIATDYIWEHEIPIAEEQRQNGNARVVPIILKPCQWTKLDFAKHQALPSKGMAITTFSDRDTAWLEVVEGIEKVINDVLKP
jgi:TIR domain/Effector-associated domain 11